MVISLALLLARCCYLFVLLLSLTNNGNSAVVAAAPSSLDFRSTPPRSAPIDGNNDPCSLSEVPSKGRYTLTSTLSGRPTCEYHLKIDHPDNEFVVKLTLSLGPPLSDMKRTSIRRQQQHERTGTTTSSSSSSLLSPTTTTTIMPPPPPSSSSITTTASINEIPTIAHRGSIITTPGSSFVPTTSVPENDNDEYDNSNSNAKGLDPPQKTRESPSLSSSSERVRRPSSTHHSSPGIDPESRQRIGASYPPRVKSADYLNQNGANDSDNNDDDDEEEEEEEDHIYKSKENSQSSLEAGNGSSTTNVDKPLSSSNGDKSLPTSFCYIKLKVQAIQKPSQDECLLHGGGQEGHTSVIYFYRDEINVTVSWDPGLDSAIHLRYTMVKAAKSDVDCSIPCSSGQVCLLDSKPCDDGPKCPQGAEETPASCTLNKSSPKPQHDQSTLNLHLIVIFSVVALVVVLVICGCLLYRHDKCPLGMFFSSDTLLRQQQRPHSHSSEMNHSPSGSMQDTSGQYDQRVALLQDRYQHHNQTLPSSPLVQPLPLSGPSSNAHQPCNLPSHHHNHHHHHHQHHQQAPLSPYFRPTQSSYPLTQCNGNAGHGSSRPFLSKGMSVSKSFNVRSPQTYPHHIAMSRDGEEGYKAAQQDLHSIHQQQQNWLVQNEVFRAPPNKTIYDRDSAPPPYSLNAPASATTKSPELPATYISGVSAPLLVCTSSSVSSSGSNNNNNSFNNNNTLNSNNNKNKDKCKNQGSPQSTSVLGGCPISSYTEPPSSIYQHCSLPASGPPPDYHQVASAFSQRGHNPSGISSQFAPPNLPLDQTSLMPLQENLLLEDGYSPVSSSTFHRLSPLTDSSNTFVVTNGSPSVCPGPDLPILTHNWSGNECGKSCCSKRKRESNAPNVSWSATAVPLSQLTDARLSLSSSSSTSSILPSASLYSLSASLSHQVDADTHLASALTVVAPVLENVAPEICNVDNISYNTNNSQHNSFNMINDIPIGHCNNATTISNHNISYNNNTYYNNNNNNNINDDNDDGDLECVANNCGLSSRESPRMTIRQAPQFSPVAPHLSIPAASYSVDTTSTQMLSSSPTPLSLHHQHPSPLRHCPINRRLACQPQASPERNLDATDPSSAHRPSLPNATIVVDAESGHSLPNGINSPMPLCEANGNVFPCRVSSQSTLTTTPSAIVLDPNGNHYEVQSTTGNASVASSLFHAQGCSDADVDDDPNKNCDWSKSIEALSKNPLVLSSVDPCSASSTPCCDNNTSAATTTTTTLTTISSFSSSSPFSSLSKAKPANMDSGPNIASAESEGVGSMPKEETMGEEEDQDVGVVVFAKSCRSPTCTAAQERVE